MHRYFLTLTALVLLPSSLWAKAAEPTPTEFIRVERSDQKVALQTAVTRYSRNGVDVDLIGAVHIADLAYYQQLNTDFQSYPVLLFEMIGGEDFGKEESLPETAEVTKTEASEANESNLNFLNTLYAGMQSMLELSGQGEHIDYTAKNFLHADLTLKEFQTLQAERKESILSFALEQSFQPQTGNQPSSLGLLLAIISRDANKLKLQLVDTLGEGDNQIASLTGENVIIGDRNIKCLEVMDKQIKAGKKKLGIFYGAAHYPDMEKRLLKMGFKKGKQNWLDAWVIPKS